MENSWKPQDAIVASSKGDSYAYCKLYGSHLSLNYGGLSDISLLVLITLLFLLHLSKKERIFIDHFYESAQSFYIAFVRKLKLKFYF